jgi:signal transduction histidine kinase
MGSERDLNKTLLGVADREQKLISQELHDTLCQTLVGLSLLAKAALRARERGDDVEVNDLRRISEHLDKAIEQSRLLVLPQALFVRPAGLAHALEELAQWSSAKIRCELRVEGEASTTDPQLALAFYRVARETAQNILQDGKASWIRMTFSRQESRLMLEITCDRQPGPDSTVFDGDGLLKRFADAAGLNWVVKPHPGHESTLQVSAVAA